MKDCKRRCLATGIPVVGLASWPVTGFSSTWECCDLALKKGGNTILMTQIFQSFSCLFFLLLQLDLFPTTNFLSPKEFSR